MERAIQLTTEEGQQAENYYRLATLAAARFDSRRGVEWKTALGVWTLFGAGAVAMVAADHWSAHWWPDFVIALIVTVLILVLYWRWHLYIGEAMHRDQLIGYYWESGIQNLLGSPIPAHLEPGRFLPDEKTSGSECPFSRARQ
jgi:hypothetical protein